MLVKYRKDYQKIVLGLLSFSPDLDNYDRLQEEIDWSNSAHQPIYLWRAPYSEQFIGVAVLEEGTDYIFLSAIAKHYEPKRLMGTLATQPLVTNWARSTVFRVQPTEEE